MLAAFGGVLLTAGRNVAPPLLVGAAFSRIVGGDGTWTTIVQIAIVLGVIAIIGNITDLLGAYSFEVLGARMQQQAREELTISLLGKSQTFHNRQRIGDLMARTTNDIRLLWDMHSPGFSVLTDVAFSVVAITITIGILDWRLLAAPLAFLIVGGTSLFIYNRQLAPLTGAQREAFGRANATLNEAVSGIEVVKAAGQEAQEEGKFGDRIRSVRHFAVGIGQMQARYYPMLVLAVTAALGVLQAFWLYSREAIGIGTLVAFIGLMLDYRHPAQISSWMIGLCQQGIAGCRRIIELLNTETELDERVDGYAAPMRGEITFEHVSFGYGEKMILRDLSFRITPGATVAIVGQTGSGKTTLTHLVNRTYDVTSGRILVDGVDVRDWNLDSLRGQIGAIEQDIFLFSRSVRDNIAFGAPPGTPDEAVLAAARDAQADGFVRNFRDGYDAEIGERGVNLSGGQRQRLAIARALLTDPRILVLDDATSAIDSATEDEIQLALRKVQSGRTTLMITHRLSQIRWADHILVLDDGRLLDEGDHETLMGRCPLYHRIFNRYASAA